MRLVWLKKLLFTTGFLLLMPLSLIAHPFDEINHSIVFRFQDDSNIRIEYSIYLGGQYQLEWTRYDTPLSRTLEKPEQDKWAEYILQNILLKVNDVPIDLQTASAVFPVFNDFFTSTDPYIRFIFETTKPVSFGKTTDVYFNTFVYDKTFIGRIEYGWNGRKLAVQQELPAENPRKIKLVLTASDSDTNMPLKNPPPPARQKDSLIELLEQNIYWALLAAFGFGLLHALQPGHGKAIVGAYLIASEGRIIDAVLLGIIVTLTHTLAVIILAGVVGYLISTGATSEETVKPWLMLCSGGIIAVIGVWMFIARGILGHTHTHSHGAGHEHEEAHPHTHENNEHAHSDEDEHDHNHHHDHDHDHGHHHDHSHDNHHHEHTEEHGHDHPHEDTEHDHEEKESVENKRPGLWSLLSLGISGGMVPCPEALALLVFAVAAGQAAKALFLILSFSAGLAVVLIVIGIVMVLTKKMFAKSKSTGKIIRILPFVSSVFITTVGLVLLLKALEVMNVIGKTGWLPF